MKFYLFLGMCLLSACTGSLPPMELTTWLENDEHGLFQTQKEETFSLNCSVLPASLLAYKQLHILEERYDDSTFEALEEEYNKGFYLKFSIDFSERTAEAKEFYEANADYLNFFMARDLHLVAGNDTLVCSMANLERSANFSPSFNYELAFDRPLNWENSDLTLLYQGELTNNLPRPFTFTKSDIKDIPKLKR